MNKVLIWSNKHGAWWRAGSLGYTTVLTEAGYYAAEEAAEIVYQSSMGGLVLRDGVEVPPTVAVVLIALPVPVFTVPTS